jgi:uncharacterized membrane protein YeaQ/YmgE (transglycosylase-associated protein family)
MDLLWFLIIGLVAGWLAGQFVKGGGFGMVGDLIVGVIGAFVGGLLFRLVGLGAVGLIGELLVATVGAIVLLVVVRTIKRA